MDKIIEPDFLIVGAPKCGTTALNDFLAQHPDVNLIEKELHYFGKDLYIKNNKRPASDYFSRFKEGKLNGDASVWYLYSDSIFEELKTLKASPKIIIMLRNPVDFIYSLHSQNLFDANEDEQDFEKALRLEKSRKNGENIPETNNIKTSLAYREVALFYKRVQKYIESLPSENIFIGLQEELKNAPNHFLKEIELFLELKPFKNYNFATVNANKKVKNLKIHQTIKSPSSFKKKLIRTLIPSKKAREIIADRIYNSNFKESERNKMPEKLRNELTKEFSPSIDELANLINKDLSHWKS